MSLKGALASGLWHSREPLTMDSPLAASDSLDILSRVSLNHAGTTVDSLVQPPQHIIRQFC